MSVHIVNLGLWAVWSGFCQSPLTGKALGYVPVRLHALFLALFFQTLAKIKIDCAGGGNERKYHSLSLMLLLTVPPVWAAKMRNSSFYRGGVTVNWFETD
jgi:hypothetical protein